MTPSDALRRVLGLFALARSPNRKEAASARRQAMRLSRLHNLTPLDIARAQRAERVRSTRSAVSMTQLDAAWEVRLYLVIGIAFGCNTGTSPGLVRFDGPGATAARDTAERVHAGIRRWLEENRGSLVTTLRAHVWGLADEVLLDGFLFALGDTIAARLDAHRKHDPAPPPPAPASADTSPPGPPAEPPPGAAENERWAAEMRARLALAENVARLFAGDPWLQPSFVRALDPMEPTVRAAEADLDSLAGVVPPTTPLLLESQ